MNIRRYEREYLKVRRLQGVVRMDDRYCSVEESLRDSLQQMQLMKKGIIPKKTWKDFCLEMEKGENN